MNIFVAKLGPNTTGEDLRELFSEYGEVTSANVIMDRDTGQSKRFGFVEMANDEEALKAIDQLDSTEFDNSEIVVKKAKPRENNGGGPRRSGGGGGYNKPRYEVVCSACGCETTVPFEPRSDRPVYCSDCYRNM